uniref:C-X9-C motif containing 4 n=1 Tax=Paramormyrops kingsleyae TaxID=1676925 RepID=A0A3B3S3A1_9TELE|nr:cx9C motif-containing protein 4 [Paramormyrops kingsleyae]XP_023700861.1 cx9C motif-containing protein 4 [Paramormyrops kingsleyae]
MSRKKDPCQKQACEIQKCLKENKYMESRCEDVIREMRHCCQQHAAEKSVCCSGFRKKNKTAENNEVLSSSYPVSACL